MFLTPSFPLQPQPLLVWSWRKGGEETGHIKHVLANTVLRWLTCFVLGIWLKQIALWALSSFLKRFLCRVLDYSSCWSRRFSSSGPAGLPQLHLMPRCDLLSAIIRAFSGAGQTSVLCVPSCREPPNSAVTRPPTRVQEVALSMLLLGAGSDLKHGFLQINTLRKWVPNLFAQSYCIHIVVPTSSGDDRGWDGWMASLTRWTWVWVNSGSWWWTGRPGVLRFMGSQRVGHDWVTDLIWSEPVLEHCV